MANSTEIDLNKFKSSQNGKYSERLIIHGTPQEKCVMLVFLYESYGVANEEYGDLLHWLSSHLENIGYVRFKELPKDTEKVVDGYDNKISHKLNIVKWTDGLRYKVYTKKGA